MKGKIVKTAKIFPDRLSRSHGITAHLYDFLDTVFLKSGFHSLIIKPKEQQEQKKPKIEKEIHIPKTPPKQTPKNPKSTKICKNALHLRLISFSMNKYP